MIFFPFQQASRLSHTVGLLGQALATMATPPASLLNLGSSRDQS
ncbi:hypothetical protein QA943_23665 [Streptomyces sp. B21-097]